MIRANKIIKKYKDVSGEILAVNSVDLHIEQGEFVSVVGRSGSGKSTLLKMMGGLLKPTSGKVIIDNVDIYNLSEKKLSDYRCNKVGFVFQDFFLEELYTVYQNLEVVLMISGVPDKERGETINRALESVNMLHKKDSYVKTLSGGEKQRVCIARAVVNNPSIVFADEPCGNLDYDNGQTIMKLLRRQCEDGKTVVLITHNLEDAKLTDRIITLKDGCVVDNEN